MIKIVRAMSDVILHISRTAGIIMMIFYLFMLGVEDLRYTYLSIPVSMDAWTVYLQPAIIMCGAVFVMYHNRAPNVKSKRLIWCCMQIVILFGAFCFAYTMVVYLKYSHQGMPVSIKYGMIIGCVCIGIKSIANLTDVWRCG